MSFKVSSLMRNFTYRCSCMNVLQITFLKIKKYTLCPSTFGISFCSTRLSEGRRNTCHQRKPLDENHHNARKARKGARQRCRISRANAIKRGKYVTCRKDGTCPQVMASSFVQRVFPTTTVDGDMSAKLTSSSTLVFKRLLRYCA